MKPAVYACYCERAANRVRELDQKGVRWKYFTDIEHGGHQLQAVQCLVVARPPTWREGAGSVFVVWDSFDDLSFGEPLKLGFSIIVR